MIFDAKNKSPEDIIFECTYVPTTLDSHQILDFCLSIAEYCTGRYLEVYTEDTLADTNRMIKLARKHGRPLTNFVIEEGKALGAVTEDTLAVRARVILHTYACMVEVARRAEAPVYYVREHALSIVRSVGRGSDIAGRELVIYMKAQLRLY